MGHSSYAWASAGATISNLRAVSDGCAGMHMYSVHGDFFSSDMCAFIPHCTSCEWDVVVNFE